MFKNSFKKINEEEVVSASTLKLEFTQPDSEFDENLSKIKEIDALLKTAENEACQAITILQIIQQ